MRRSCKLEEITEQKEFATITNPRKFWFVYIERLLALKLSSRRRHFLLFSDAKGLQVLGLGYMDTKVRILEYFYFYLKYTYHLSPLVRIFLISEYVFIHAESNTIT